MSLATRCSACGTTFRVVQDQLKVSEGWVRCGRCEVVFNAVEGLFDLERDAPGRPRRTGAAGAPAALPPAAPAITIAIAGPASSAPPATPGPVVQPAAPAAGAAPTTASVSMPLASAAPAPPPAAAVWPPAFVASRPHDDAPDAEDGSDAPTPLPLEKPGPKPATSVRARDRLEFSDARFDSDLFEEEPPENDAGAPTVFATAPGSLPLESDRSPEFLRRPERRPGWRTRGASGLMAVLFGLSLAALGAQIAVHHRAAIAAAWPWTEAPLGLACAVGGCTVDAPRRIDALTVESTALARAVGQDGFVLTVALRNRGASALVTPSVDLTLTDGSGRLVARRALAPFELHAAPSVAAGADLQLQAALDVRGVRIAGYTVEIFYP